MYILGGGGEEEKLQNHTNQGDNKNQAGCMMPAKSHNTVMSSKMAKNDKIKDTKLC